MEKFTASQFTPTQWSTAQDKADFCNCFVRFVKSGYKQNIFTEEFYTRLSMCFGHIAHYDRQGFYETFFTSLEGQIRFAETTLIGGGYGDPHFTYCDAEKLLRAWAIKYKMLDKAQQAYNERVEKDEREHLAYLVNKYGTS